MTWLCSVEGGAGAHLPAQDGTWLPSLFHGPAPAGGNPLLSPRDVYEPPEIPPGSALNKPNRSLLQPPMS